MRADQLRPGQRFVYTPFGQDYTINDVVQTYVRSTIPANKDWGMIRSVCEQTGRSGTLDPDAKVRLLDD